LIGGGVFSLDKPFNGRPRYFDPAIFDPAIFVGSGWLNTKIVCLIGVNNLPEIIQNRLGEGGRDRLALVIPFYPNGQMFSDGKF